MELKLTVLLLLVTSLTTLKVVAKTIVREGRIVGGNTAKEGTVPHIVSLQTIWGHFCGGSIINKQWIVTAGHCVVNKYSNNIRVFTGTQDWTNSAEATIYYVDRMFIHCNFDEPLNDIALLRLNDTIGFDERTQPIPLATKPLTKGDTVTLSGWGQENEYDDIVDKLKTIDLKYLPYEECKEAHGNSRDLGIGHICSFTKRGEGSCHHDSGSPLVSDGKLVGVVSWGIPCAVGKPDAFSSIVYYYDWIRSIVLSDGDCDCNAFIKGERIKKKNPFN